MATEKKFYMAKIYQTKEICFACSETESASSSCYRFKNSFQYMNTPAYLCNVKIKAMYGLVLTHNCNNMKMHNNKLSLILSIKLTISTHKVRTMAVYKKSFFS